MIKLKNGVFLFQILLEAIFCKPHSLQIFHKKKHTCMRLINQINLMENLDKILYRDEVDHACLFYFPILQPIEHQQH